MIHDAEMDLGQDLAPASSPDEGSVSIDMPPLLANEADVQAAVAAARAAQPAWDAVPAVQRGLLLEEGERWRLRDPEGLALSNGVLRELLAWWERWDGSGWRSSPAGPPPPAAGLPAAAD